MLLDLDPPAAEVADWPPRAECIPPLTLTEPLCANACCAHSAAVGGGERADADITDISPRFSLGIIAVRLAGAGLEH